MKKWLAALRHEFVTFIPALIYFVVTFNLIHYAENLILAQNNVRFYSYWTVTVGALIVAKCLIIVNWLPFINLFPARPLVYNIVWKFFIYNIFIFVVRLIELTIDLVREFETFDGIRLQVYNALSHPIFWTGEVTIAMVLFGFILYTEVAKSIGEEKVRKLIFG